jgi:hypothetical protein
MPLPSGNGYQYPLRATFMQAGKEVTHERSLSPPGKSHWSISPPRRKHRRRNELTAFRTQRDHYGTVIVSKRARGSDTFLGFIYAQSLFFNASVFTISSSNLCPTFALLAWPVNKIQPKWIVDSRWSWRLVFGPIARMNAATTTPKRDVDDAAMVCAAKKSGATE